MASYRYDDVGYKNIEGACPEWHANKRQRMTQRQKNGVIRDREGHRDRMTE